MKAGTPALGRWMDLHAAFEQDLHAWVGEIYSRLERQDRFEQRAAVERIVDRTNRLFIILIAILAGSILLLPLVGAGSVLAGLVVLYAGALGASILTVIRVRALERPEGAASAMGRRRDRAWDDRPVLGFEAQATLVRIMNLSRLRSTASVLLALDAELAEARALPDVGSWSALVDADILVREPPPSPPDD